MSAQANETYRTLRQATLKAHRVAEHLRGIEAPEGYSGKPYNVQVPSVEASCQAIWLALAKRRALEGDFSGATDASVNVSALRASKAIQTDWERKRRAALPR